MRYLLVLAALASFALGCGANPSTERIVVLGLDGVDPRIVDLLMAEGKMPNFARLRQEGAYGRLLSSEPMLSPILWTTIATGKPPQEHGIGHFVAVNEKTGEQLPVTSQMRRVKAIWNILSDAGRRVAVVGWWATWPAETVRGTIVSDHVCYHFLLSDGAAEEGRAPGITFPAEAQAELAPLIRRPGDVTLEEAARFVHVGAEDFARPFAFSDDLSQFRWALATAESYRRIGLHLWERERPDLLMVYVEGVDSTSHLFGHLFRASGLAGELAAQQERYGGTVEEMYRYVDGLVGDFTRVLDRRSTLVVLSDHGFELGAVPDDPSKTRDMRRVSERYHRREGIVYLYGNRVRPRGRLDQPRQLDVTPTLLALAGLAPARDMPGRVWTEGLDVNAEPPSVASYETERSRGGEGARPTRPSIPPSSSGCAASATWARAHRRATATSLPCTSRPDAMPRPWRRTKAWCASTRRTAACRRASRARSGRSDDSMRPSSTSRWRSGSTPSTPRLTTTGRSSSSGRESARRRARSTARPFVIIRSTSRRGRRSSV